MLLRDRRALELIAFYDAHTQMSPNEAFPISIDGHVQSRSDEVRLCGDAVTFHVGPQVRMWGGKMVRAVLREYAQQYGPRPWLGEEFRGEEGGGNGRVYHISFTADNGQDDSCFGEAPVNMPKNQGKKGAAIDDGALFDSTIP